MSYRNTEIRVRPAGPRDLAAVAALDAEATGVAKRDYWQACLGRFRGKDRHFLLAVRGAEVVGFIVGEVRAWEFGSPPAGWIFAVNVERRAREHGLATLLFEAMIERFRAARVTHVRTMVAKEDTLVMAFFRSQGMMAGPFLELERAI